MKIKSQRRRRPYSCPTLTVVNLRAEEVLASVCKSTTQNGALTGLCSFNENVGGGPNCSGLGS